MEFSARKDDLVRELALIQGIVERKNTIPILANVLIEADDSGVQLSATDLDVGLRCRLEAQVTKAGALTLSAKKLYEIVRSVSDPEIRVQELENSWAAITSGGAYFKMVGLGKTEFPSLAEPAAGEGTRLSGAAARRAHQQNQFRHHRRRQSVLSQRGATRAHGERHPHGCDGRPSPRLRGAEEAAGGRPVPTSVIVPKKTLMELLKILGEDETTVTFAEGENHLFFRIGERLLVSKRVDDQFPAYDKVIPRAERQVGYLWAGRPGRSDSTSLAPGERALPRRSLRHRGRPRRDLLSESRARRSA